MKNVKRILFFCLAVGLSISIRADYSSNFKDQNLSVGSSELSWSANPSFTNFESNNNARGAQSASANTNIVLTSGNVSGTITKIEAVVSTNDADGSISAKIGGSTFGSSENFQKKNPNTKVTITGSATVSNQTIVLTIKRNSKTTFWIKSIKVTSTESGGGGGGGGGSTYTITAVSSNTIFGTVSVSGNTITATPKDGYRVKSGDAGYTITNGTATVTNNGNNTFTVNASSDCSITINFEKKPEDGNSMIEVVEVGKIGSDYGIFIEHDLDGDASITLSQKEEHQAEDDTALADELFFSKYFEADSENKLIAIFNGTQNKISLANYKLKRSNRNGASSVTEQTLELKDFGRKEKGYIYPREEIIIVAYSTGATSAKPCAEKQKGYENWYDADDFSATGFMSFSGPMSIGLYKNSKCIDVIGATTKADGTGGLVQINASNSVDCNFARPTINGEQYNDKPGGFYSLHGHNVKDGTDEYFLSTNRCLLIRDKQVKSGANAVKYNVYNKQIDCSANIVHAFVTLGDTTISGEALKGEWHGFRIGSGDNASKLTCEGLGYVGGFDYSQYYVTYSTISTDITLADIQQPDGTSFIKVPDMKDRACKELKIEVKGGSLTETIEKLYDVPIIIEGNMTTADNAFNLKKDTCKVCDVAILDGAMLTRVNENGKHYGDSARTVDIYAGGKLIVPSGRTYYAENVILRTRSSKPSQWVLDAPEVVLNNSHMEVPNTAASPTVGQRVRIETGSNADLNFYMVSFPYDVVLSDVTFSDGTPATFNTDFFIYHYDGEKRAANQVASGNWVSIPATTTELKAGVGYLVAAAERTGHKYRELYFPMKNPALNAATGEADKKYVDVNAWGYGISGKRPNHVGWNFVANPYLRTYQKDKLDDDNSSTLSLGLLVMQDDGYWESSAPYVEYVTVLNSTATRYEQRRVSDKDLPAFQPFFIQIGRDGMTAGQGAKIEFKAANRAAASPIRRAVGDKPQKSSFGLLLSGADDEDNCGVVIGEQYSPAYEVMADLSKEFGSAYTLSTYTLQDNDNMRLAFHAVHPDRLTNVIPVGVRVPSTAEYTFRIDQRYDLSDFEHIYLQDTETGAFKDLLYETLSFSSGKAQIDNRFKLSVVMRAKTPTDIENTLSGIFASGRNGALMISGLPEKADIYVFDISGRLMVEDHTTRLNTAVYPLSSGVYQVRVEGEGKQVMLRTIVK